MGLFGRDDTTRRSSTTAGDETAGSERSTSTPEQADRTVIASSIHIEGALQGSGEVLVFGKVTGTIDCSGGIHVAARGSVAATVHGRSVVVAGTVKGDITADERIELEPSANVDGDMTAPRILIRDGATFRGQVNMKTPPNRPKPKAQPGSPKVDPSGQS
jgi:cytoskeletal protein CcmA (bactofilin family)